MYKMHESDRWLVNILYCIFQPIYHYLGFEYIYRKAVPTKEPQQPPLPTLSLWLIGFYVASFGVASQRYENRVDIIENKVNAIYLQVASSDQITKGMAFRGFQKIQEMKCPYKPEIKNPVSIYLSFFRQSTYEGVANLMKETVENWKGDLNGVDLSGTNLKRFNLEGADFRNTNLERANLAYANLKEANLEGETGVGINQLATAKTLYKAKLEPELMKQVKEKYPHLLEMPKKEETKPDE